MENSSQNKVAKRLPWEKPSFKTFEIDINLQTEVISGGGGGGGNGGSNGDFSNVATRRNVNTDVETSSGSMFESNSFNDNPFATE